MLCYFCQVCWMDDRVMGCLVGFCAPFELSCVLFLLAGVVRMGWILLFVSC